MQDEGQRARLPQEEGSGSQLQSLGIDAAVFHLDDARAVPPADSGRAKRESGVVRRRLRLARAVSDVSSAFATDQDFRTPANTAVAIMGLACGAEHSRLFLFRENGKIISAAGEWIAGSARPRGEVFQNQPTTAFPWWVSKLRAREIIQVGDVRLLPPEAEAERQILQAQGIRSIVAFPVAIRSTVAGFVTLDNIANAGSWQDDDISPLRTCAEIIAGALERRRAERSLQSERAQLGSIFDSLDAIVYVSDPSTHELLYVNKAVRDALGNHLVGGICYRELQKADAPCSFCTDSIIFANGGKPYTWEHHNAVTKRDYLVIDRAIKWTDGRDVRFEFATDITERKRSEEALKASEANYRAVFDTASDAIFVHDVETGAILDANQRMTEMFGYTLEEAKNLPAEITGVGAPEEIQRQIEARVRRAAHGESQLFEWLARDRNGREFWVEVNLKRAAIAGQDRLLAVARDISERKAGEERILEDARRAEALSEVSQLLAEASIDIDSALKSISRRVAKLMGQSCVIRLLCGGDGQVITAAAYYWDADRKGDLCAFTGFPSEPVQDTPFATVLQTGKPVFLERFSLDLYRAWIDREWYDYIRARGPYSALLVPLRARGRAVGVIGVLRQATVRQFDGDDQEFLQNIADRVALAIANAALYEDLQRELTERERAERRLAQLNECLLGFGPDSGQNINGLVALCGQLMGADAALYVHLEGGRFDVIGRWNVPSGRESLDRLVECPFCAAIMNGENDFLAVSEPAEIAGNRPDLQITTYGLKTIVGHVVKRNGQRAGVLCVGCQAAGNPDGEDRKLMGIIASAIGVEEQRRQADLQRREAQSRFEMVIENTPLVAIRGFDLDGVVRHWNRASERLFGYEAGEVTGHRVLDVLPVETGHGEFETMFREVVGSGRAALPREREVLTRSGQRRTVYTTVFPVYEGEEPTEVFCMDVDITERKMQEEQLAYLATHDTLTGLPNRRSLEESLQTALALSRCGVENALIFLDVDNFKLVNDTLGHDAGDDMLVTITGLLKDNLRGTDLLARLGGDEFAALLRDTGIEEAQAIAERLRRAVEERCFTVKGLAFDLSLSIGVVVVGSQATPALVLSQGDAAMYKAKNHGRNRLAVYNSEHDERTQLFEANRAVAQIKDALRDDRFTLYYQPVVRLEDGSVAYYEALVRLLGENGEALAAGAFIPTAERFGLIPQVTRLVVQQAVQALRAHPTVCLSVNLSGLDLCDGTLPEFVEARLRDQSIDPARLGFEVTETALIKDLVQAERWITRIKSLGCHFALDNFGAGFVSFAYLRNLTVDQLKIDGSLVRALETDHTQSAFVRALHLLATTQGKETVAECVENANVVCLLRELGITYGQGYHLGLPSPILP